MSLKGAVLRISEDERLEMQAVVMDRDSDGALRLVKRLLERIAAIERREVTSQPGN